MASKFTVEDLRRLSEQLRPHPPWGLGVKFHEELVEALSWAANEIRRLENELEDITLNAKEDQ